MKITKIDLKKKVITIGSEESDENVWRPMTAEDWRNYRMKTYTRKTRAGKKLNDPNREPPNFFTEVVEKAGQDTTPLYAKEALGSSVIIAVGLRIEDEIRHCLPVEIKIKNGKVIEAAPIYPEAEEISYALARAAGALEEKAERASTERWPPDYEKYELVGAALQRLAKPMQESLGPEGLGEVPNAPDGLPAAVIDELEGRWPLWRRSVNPVLLMLRNQSASAKFALEYRETLTSHKWSVLNREGNAISTLSISKG